MTAPALKSEVHGAYLVRGDDPSLVAQRAREVVEAATGGEDPSSTVEEHGAGGEDIDVAAVVDALTTPPFISPRRVVVVRDAGRLAAADAARLAECIDDPVPDVVLVLVAGGGTMPQALVKAVQRVGVVEDSAVGSGRARTQWLVEQLQDGPVRLDARAASMLGEHLGNDLARLHGLLETLCAAYGEGAAVDEEHLAPFLGEAGAVAPWDLTDALDAGDTAGALLVLHRLCTAGGFHPLAVMAVLQRHFSAMLRLDGAPVTTPEEAAQMLGIRSAFPARKALEQGRKLGAARIGRAVTLLADADLDLRGRTGLDGATVLEVLVARLSRLAPPADARAQRRGGRATRGTGRRR